MEYTQASDGGMIRITIDGKTRYYADYEVEGGTNLSSSKIHYVTVGDNKYAYIDDYYLMRDFKLEESDFDLSRYKHTFWESDYGENAYEYALASAYAQFYPDHLLKSQMLVMIKSPYGSYSFICYEEYKNYKDIYQKYDVDIYYLRDNVLYKGERSPGAYDFVETDVHLLDVECYEYYFVPKYTAQELKDQHDRKIKQINNGSGSSSTKSDQKKAEERKYEKQKLLMSQFYVDFSDLSDTDRRGFRGDPLEIIIENYDPAKMDNNTRKYVDSFLKVASWTLTGVSLLLIAIPEGTSSAIGIALLKSKNTITIAGRTVSITQAALDAKDGNYFDASQKVFFVVAGAAAPVAAGRELNKLEDVSLLAADILTSEAADYFQKQLNEISRENGLGEFLTSDLADFYNVRMVSLEMI